MVVKERQRKQSDLVRQLNQVRSQIILKTCRDEAWHIGRVAEKLGIYRSQLYDFIKEDPALLRAWKVARGTSNIRPPKVGREISRRRKVS